MQNFIGSVRRSFVFKPPGGPEDEGIGSGFGELVEKIGSSIRKSSVGIFSRPPFPALPAVKRAETAQVKSEPISKIRWRKGEWIGGGAFGRVYMGMNLDSGELLAVKEVSVAANSASKEKTQAHVRELEEEVNLLKNLSHPNIVRYLGTAREDDSLNILLEFVSGGSISSLLGKFGSFPEPVIRMYTKQLLLGLEYLHKNGIIHRDIKGANILVDNKGCIKLADFGASKKVVELATMTGAKSMKGTPYWMAPEVILQTGHSFSADIWSVGCTIIEMATGKPPWSQQYQEVAALFHIGTTKSHPPIPDHLSTEAKDFLLKCLQEEPNLRPSASDLLQHPFVTNEYQETHLSFRNSLKDNSACQYKLVGSDPKKSMDPQIKTNCTGLKDACGMGSMRCSTVCPGISGGDYMWKSNGDDDMCRIDEKDDFMIGDSALLNSTILSNDLNKSFNPMCEPTDDLPCKFDESPELERSQVNLFSDQRNGMLVDRMRASTNIDFAFSNGSLAADDDDEVTESKIRAFLDEKVLELKKLQTPLYEEFYNSLNGALPPSPVAAANKENLPNNLQLPPKSRSPTRVLSRRFSSAADAAFTSSPRFHCRRVSNAGIFNNKVSQELQSPEQNEWKEPLIGSQQEVVSPSSSFIDIQRKWKEELVEELQRKREMIRQAAVVKTPSPSDRIKNRHRDRSRDDEPRINRQRDRSREEHHIPRIRF